MARKSKDDNVSKRIRELRFKIFAWGFLSNFELI